MTKSILTAAKFFPSRMASRPVMFCGEKCAKLMQNMDCFLPKIFIYGGAKKPGEKRKFSSSPLANKMLASTNRKTIKFFMFVIINILLTELSRSVCMGESWPRS